MSQIEFWQAVMVRRNSLASRVRSTCWFGSSFPRAFTYKPALHDERRRGHTPTTNFAPEVTPLVYETLTSMVAGTEPSTISRLQAKPATE